MHHQPTHSDQPRQPGPAAGHPTVASVHTTALLGITAHPVRVEVVVSGGRPSINPTGMGNTAALQARDRLRAAIGNAGYPWLDRQITVSALPTDLPKQPATLDLPIALGLLAVGGTIPPEALEGLWAVGELGLGGDARATRGVLPAVLAAHKDGARTILIPAANLVDAKFAPPDINVLGVRTLADAVAWLCDTGSLETTCSCAPALPAPSPDLADVQGRPRARRALEIAAAGGHHLVLVGAHGAGRSLLARRLPGLLPDPTEAEALEIARIRSAAGLLEPGMRLPRRPIRAPHHSISQAGFTGGGPHGAGPGELSLAHHGVLFLDELDHFPSRLLDCLRQPLKEGVVDVVHRCHTIRLPARFLLVAAASRRQELGRLVDATSGLARNRISLAVEVTPQRPSAQTARPGESSAAVRARVTAARARQQARGTLNADIPNRHLVDRCLLTSQAWRVAADALRDPARLTKQDFEGALRVARTIADLAEAEHVTSEHLAEALTFLPATTPQGMQDHGGQ